MIRRLTVKIVAVVMGTMLLVFAVVLLAINLSLSRASIERVDDFMAQVAENDGFFLPSRPEPEPGRIPPEDGPAREPMREGRFFYVKLDREDSILEWNPEMMFDFSLDDARGYIDDALADGRPKGTAGSFRYLRAEKPYGSILVFAERSIELGILQQLTRTSLWAAGIVSVVLLFLSVILARWMVKPVKTAFAKQKRFISDAGHELKTPLTIIAANADLLNGEVGDDSRLSHIKAQTARMSALIHDLLTLAKTDEAPPRKDCRPFDAGKAVFETVLEFECRAYEAGKRYSYQIGDNLNYNGEETQIKRLTGLLIDNALRYSDEGGEVRVTFRSAGNRLHLSVYNTGPGVPLGERDKIFERFYRSDQSRSRETGGYGIGLSIAKAITESNKGKITVNGEEGKWVQFDVIL